MRVLFIIMISFIAIYAAGLGSCYAEEDKAATKLETQSFTNRDLEKYSSTSDNRLVTSKTTPKDETPKTSGSREQKEKEYWCKRGGHYQKKIDMAKDDIKEIEDSGGRTKAARKKLEASKKRLKAAERDLAEIGDEAHRKRVPPGWLRCQFE